MPSVRRRHAARRDKKGGGAARKLQGETSRRWSHRVTEHSDALDLEKNIFKTGSPREIAQSLHDSAMHSRRRKGTPFQSAMSMLNFYINRAGRNLPKARRDALQQAKPALREAFGRERRPSH